MTSSAAVLSRRVPLAQSNRWLLRRPEQMDGALVLGR
jgi:hypothetical protein